MTRRVLAVLTAGVAVLAFAPVAAANVAFCPSAVKCPITRNVCEDFPDCVPPLRCIATPDVVVCP